MVVVSSPSGGGKTTLNRLLTADHDNVEISTSHTTRSPRTGEKDGVHYHFVTEKQFNKMTDQGDFVEWAAVHGRHYGTSLQEIERIKGSGRIPLLEIDVQGWEQVCQRTSDLMSIFILPPSLKSM